MTNRPAPHIFAEAVSEATSGRQTENFLKSRAKPERTCGPRLWFATVIKLVSARVVRWSGAMCAMSSRRGPISPSRAVMMLANRTAPDVSSPDALADLHLHLEHKVNLERIAENRDL